MADFVRPSEWLYYVTAAAAAIAALICSTNAHGKDCLFMDQGPTLTHAMFIVLLWFLPIYIP